MAKEWQTRPEICKQLGISERTLYRLIQGGEVVTKREGRWVYYQMAEMENDKHVTNDYDEKKSMEMLTLLEMLSEKDKELKHYMAEFFRLSAEMKLLQEIETEKIEDTEALKSENKTLKEEVTRLKKELTRTENEIFMEREKTAALDEKLEKIKQSMSDKEKSMWWQKWFE